MIRSTIVRNNANPFLWRGLMPAAALGLLLLFAITAFASSLESETQQAVVSRLSTRGLNWVTVKADGQDIHLSGQPPTATEARLAAVIAQEARCPSWAGARSCVGGVTTHFHEVGSERSGIASPDAPSEALAGKASEDPSSEAVGRAEKAHAAGTSATHTTDAVDGGSSGTLSSGGSTSLGGSVADPAVEAEQLEPPAPAAPSPREAAACEKALARLIGKSQIRFEVGSAQLKPGSRRLLIRIADRLSECPGVVQVEGHTDAQGDATANSLLSQQRAQAVATALVGHGVAAAQLVAKGFGSTEPIATNNTATGRSQNRRIQFRVVRDSTSEGEK